MFVRLSTPPVPPRAGGRAALRAAVLVAACAAWAAPSLAQEAGPTTVPSAVSPPADVSAREASPPRPADRIDATNAPAGQSRDTEPPSEQRPVLPAGAGRPAQPRTLLMGLLDKAGVGRTLDDARVRVYGHVEGSLTYNFDSPFAHSNNGRVFDIEDQTPTLNQLTLNVQRDAVISKTDFDFGGRVEFMYGGDARFIHANGLFDHYTDAGTSRLVPGPKSQPDLVQAYADVNIPVGEGLRLRAGKFTYFKQIDPNASVFYSHSFTFGAALPFTLTGIYGTYQFNDQLTVDAGVSRGWDQSLEDNNGGVSLFGRVKYNINDQTSVAAAFITGPEQDGDNGNYRTAVDVTLSHQVNDDLLLLFDAVYGQQAQANFAKIGTGSLGGTGVFPGSSGTSQWYGLSAYAVQRVNENVSVAARGEFFRDEQGFTTSVPQTLFEATVGLTITPFPNDAYGQFLKIRPELRYDYSTKNFFDGFTRHDQWTAAVDAVFNF